MSLYLHLNKVIRSFLSLPVCIIPLTPIFHYFSSLPLSPSSLLFLPLSARGFAAQLAWSPSGVVKYKYNKDVFVLVNPFWAEKHHRSAHRCGTQSGERETGGGRRRKKHEGSAAEALTAFLLATLDLLLGHFIQICLNINSLQPYNLMSPAQPSSLIYVLF